LLSSLITFGNLGESCELTAIKAAGISLIQSFRSLILLTVIISGISFYFQNNIGPNANMKIGQLLMSMKQKSPELEIPEGVFYDGIPNSNLYVQKKDIKTGMLYGVMIYRMTGSYEDQAIILADSAMLQATAEKKHLLLHLWSGEWFENMQTEAFGNSAAVPYRRETFTAKKIVLDFDGDFNMADATSLSNDARGKSLKKIFHDIDSLNIAYDSIGHAYYKDEKMGMYFTPKINKRDSLAAIKAGMANNFNIDSTYSHLPASQKSQVVNEALSRTQAAVSDLDFKSMITKDGDKIIHDHEIEAINKFTVALSCLIFFFIGAPLGAIIRKGGLGIPVIISVLVFIVYYILDNSGYRMARGGMWSVWFGKGLAPAVLMPIAIFVTYKANKDSVVFNLDLYKEMMRKILGLRIKRHIFSKEVVIEDPNYTNDAMRLGTISNDISNYSKTQKLIGMPNPINVFFKYHPDHEIKRISEDLEDVINDLSNTRDNYILSELNNYPVVSVKAHTRPFERKWMNIVSAVLLPLGIFFYFRMFGFRIRLLRDLKTIKQTNDNITRRISNMQTIK
jgi:lipopolysaccharide export system permease protein